MQRSKPRAELAKGATAPARLRESCSYLCDLNAMSSLNHFACSCASA